MHLRKKFYNEFRKSVEKYAGWKCMIYDEKKEPAQILSAVSPILAFISAKIRSSIMR